MTGNTPYNNSSSQKERRQVLKDTLYGRTIAEQDMAGGRFAARERSTVIGRGQYPALPPDSPWHHDSVPDEEPLGIDVNAMVPTGEPHEIAASLGEVSDDAAPPSAPLNASPGEALAPRGGERPAGVSRRPRRFSKHRNG